MAERVKKLERKHEEDSTPSTRDYALIVIGLLTAGKISVDFVGPKFRKDVK